MIHGESVIVNKSGLRIPLKQLELIGIGAGTCCWALIFNDLPITGASYWNGRATAHPPQIVISPFYPDNWLLLVRIVLRLEDTAGSVHLALAALAGCHVNILSHHFTPGGHNHGTLSLVGTVQTQEIARIRDKWKQRSAELKTCDIATKQGLLRDYLPTLLAAVRNVRTHILKAHRESAFLRERFLPREESSAEKSPIRGLLVDHHNLDGETHAEISLHEIKSIEVEWLQFPAFHWLFGDLDNIIRLRCEAETGRLVVLEEDADKYHAALQNVLRRKKSVPAIASLDTEARFARLIPSRPIYGEQFRISFTHYCKLDNGEKDGARGLLAALSKQLAEAGSQIWHMSNRIVHHSDVIETARVEFWVADANHPPRDSTAFVEHLKNRVVHAVNGLPQTMRITEGPAYQRVTARRVFVSTRTDWWFDRNASTVPKLVEELLQERGLEPRVCPSKDYAGTPKRDAIKEIASCDGMIQLLPNPWPEAIDPKQAEMQWMLFEWGIALGNRKPCVLAVECFNKADLQKWQQAYRVSEGELFACWDSRSYPKTVLSSNSVQPRCRKP